MIVNSFCIIALTMYVYWRCAFYHFQRIQCILLFKMYCLKGNKIYNCTNLLHELCTLTVWQWRFWICNPRTEVYIGSIVLTSRYSGRPVGRGPTNLSEERTTHCATEERRAPAYSPLRLINVDDFIPSIGLFLHTIPASIQLSFPVARLQHSTGPTYTRIQKNWSLNTIQTMEWHE